MHTIPHYITLYHIIPHYTPLYHTIPHYTTVPLFGAPDYDLNLERDERDETSIIAQLQAIDELIKSGKVKHFGLSNETPFGVAAFNAAAEKHGFSSKPLTVQNPYNLLERNDFEMGLLETCSARNCNVGKWYIGGI